MSAILFLKPAVAPAAVGENTFPRREGAIDLLELQLSVARRADLLARRYPPGRALDRQLWLRAEQEVFETKEKAQRSDGGVTFC